MATAGASTNLNHEGARTNIVSAGTGVTCETLESGGCKSHDGLLKPRNEKVSALSHHTLLHTAAAAEGELLKKDGALATINVIPAAAVRVRAHAMHKHSRVTDMAEPATVEITPKAAATEPKGPRIPLIVFMIALDVSGKAARMLL